MYVCKHLKHAPIKEELTNIRDKENRGSAGSK